MLANNSLVFCAAIHQCTKVRKVAELGETKPLLGIESIDFGDRLIIDVDLVIELNNDSLIVIMLILCLRNRRLLKIHLDYKFVKYILWIK